MTSDEKLLNNIYKNLQNAISVLSVTVIKTPNPQFRDFLFSELVSFRNMQNNTRELMLGINMHTGSTGILEKASTRIFIKYIELYKRFDDKIAKALINASEEGIYDIIKSVNIYTGAKKESRMLAYKFIDSSEDFILKLREFL